MCAAESCRTRTCRGSDGCGSGGVRRSGFATRRRSAAAAAARRRNQGFLRQQRRAAKSSTRGRARASSRTSRAELVVTARCGTPLSELESTLGASGQMLALRAAAFRDRRDARRLHRRGACRARAAQAPARCAISCSARRSSTASGRLLCIRRPGDEERRRLRRRRACSPARSARSASSSEVSLKVPAEAGRGMHAATRDARRSGDRSDEPLGRAAAADLARRAWQGGDSRGAALRRGQRAARGVRRDSVASAAKVRRCRRSGTAIREQTDPFFSDADPLWRVSVPTLDRAARAAGGAAHRVERRIALAADQRDSAYGARQRRTAAGGHATISSGFGPLDACLLATLARARALASRAEGRVRSRLESSTPADSHALR